MILDTKILAKLIRLPLGLIPQDLVVPVLCGPLRGSKWIVGANHHSCWLGTYERKLQTRIAERLRFGMTFYDIGANVGLYSLMAARMVAPAHVYAFEPLPANVSYLQKHLLLNRVSNVEIIEAAVCDCTGVGFFREAGDRAMGFLTVGGNLTISTVSLDSLVLGGKIEAPAAIKMDIEGAEVEALRGAVSTFRQHRPILFLATHGHAAHEECCRLLASWGYGLLILQGSDRDGRWELIAEPT